MKTSELIKELQELLEEHGDLSVAVYADRGQSQMICEGGGLQELILNCPRCNAWYTRDSAPCRDYKEIIMELYHNGYRKVESQVTR